MSYGTEALFKSQAAVIYGLKAKPQYNVALGRVGEYVEAKERYHIIVKIEGQIKNILLKKENLIFVNNLHEWISAIHTASSYIPWLMHSLQPTIDQNTQLNDDEENKSQTETRSLDASDVVLIHGLQHKQEFNQLFGDIVSYNDQTKRYHVSFEYKAKKYEKSMKQSNLTLVYPSRYLDVYPPQCVVCKKVIYNKSQLLTCPGCGSLNYCSDQCRTHHFLVDGHISTACYVYKCNMLSVLNYKHIVHESYTYSELEDFEEREAEAIMKYSETTPFAGINASINDWEDWMKYFGFVDYEIVGFHSYPMTVYYILKQFVINKLSKPFADNTINIHLIGCRDNEFPGIDNYDDLSEDDSTKEVKMAVASVLWKYRWKMMSDLLLPFKLNIVCYGNEVHENATDYEGDNIHISIKRRLYIIDETVPDIVIGLHAGIHEHAEWMPVIRSCIEKKIPMMFTEISMVEYELFIRHLFGRLDVQKYMTVALNPFRDNRVLLHEVYTRRGSSINSFLYGIIGYDILKL
eukprot:263687_1